MFYVQYHGYANIEAWEYLVSTIYLSALFFYFARKKSQNIKNNPEYSYLMWGLYAKVIGGLFFSLIYFYYYKGGDTIAYFYSAVAMSKLAKIDLIGYFNVLFGENSMENRTYFNFSTGYPYAYVYFDHRTFFVIRVISPLVILALDSYLITTVVLASLSYLAIWRLYRTMVSYFPDLRKELAWAVLFMPSCIFWGSAILKDTFTLSAVAMWVHCIDEVFYKKRYGPMKVVALLLSAFVMIMVKPYIFMVLLPVTLVWVFYFRVVSIKSSVIKFVVLPISMVVLFVASITLLLRLESSLGKFSLQNAIVTIEVNQADMKRSEQYGENYFDIGEFDGTWTGLLGKFPVASMAGLFRPFLWEARNVVMALSGVENLWLLWLFASTVYRAGPGFFLRAATAMPLLLMSLLFAIMLAFVVGATTPNFGALVRFKIPLIPFLVSGMFMVRYITAIRDHERLRGRLIDLSEFANGTGSMLMPSRSSARRRAGVRGGKVRTKHR